MAKLPSRDAEDGAGEFQETAKPALNTLARDIVALWTDEQLAAVVDEMVTRESSLSADQRTLLTFLEDARAERRRRNG